MTILTTYSWSTNPTVLLQVRHVSRVKVTKVYQEVPRKSTSLALDSASLTCSAEVGAESLFYALHLAYVVVDAGKGILDAQIE
jgi:hypothetical protein